MAAYKSSDPELEAKVPGRDANFISGGDDRNRTCDPLNANQVLSQLSYIPFTRVKLVAGTGFEPATFGL